MAGLVVVLVASLLFNGFLASWFVKRSTMVGLGLTVFGGLLRSRT